jgi:hypothetical protein
VCELAIALQSFVVTSFVCECTVNQVANENLFYNHAIKSRNNIFKWDTTKLYYSLSAKAANIVLLLFLVFSYGDSEFDFRTQCDLNRP